MKNILLVLILFTSFLTGCATPLVSGNKIQPHLVKNNEGILVGQLMEMSKTFGIEPIDHLDLRIRNQGSSDDRNAYSAVDKEGFFSILIEPGRYKLSSIGYSNTTSGYKSKTTETYSMPININFSVNKSGVTNIGYILIVRDKSDHNKYNMLIFDNQEKMKKAVQEKRKNMTDVINLADFSNSYDSKVIGYEEGKKIFTGVTPKLTPYY
jgi:hypothetical protein